VGRAVEPAGAWLPTVLVEVERGRFGPEPPVALEAKLRSVSMRASGAAKNGKNGQEETKAVLKRCDERDEQKTINEVCLLASRDSSKPALRGRRKPLHLVFVKVADRAPPTVARIVTFINPGVWSIR
jgi:hypothetical protein